MDGQMDGQNRAIFNANFNPIITVFETSCTLCYCLSARVLLKKLLKINYLRINTQKKRGVAEKKGKKRDKEGVVGVVVGW